MNVVPSAKSSLLNIVNTPSGPPDASASAVCRSVTEDATERVPRYLLRRRVLQGHLWIAEDLLQRQRALVLKRNAKLPHERRRCVQRQSAVEGVRNISAALDD